MQLENYFDFFENPYVIRIKGRRIGLEHIVERYKAGQSPEQITAYFGDLPVESVYAAIAYYLHNQATIDAYVADIEREFEEQVRQARANPSPIAQRMMAIKEQWRREGRVPVEDTLSAR